MPPRKAFLRRARQWIANRGLLSFVRMASRRLWDTLRGRHIAGAAQPDTGPHPFDLKHGVDTTGLLYGEALFADGNTSAAGKGAHYWVTGYYGVAPSAFCAALQRLDLPWDQFTFVDIGCGMGRALLLAQRYPFQEIVGVELAPQLAAVAETNLERFHAQWQHPGTAARVLTGDATQLPLPAGPLLLFLYHPFAEPVMRRFVAHLQQALREQTREVYLLYANPELAFRLAQLPGFCLLWRDVFPFSAEDIAADRFGSTYEQIAAFYVTG